MLLTEPDILIVFFLLCLLSSGWGAIVNRTIDDSEGDSETGLRPLYLPNTVGVWKGLECMDCFIRPDVTQTFGGTYTAATYRPPLTSMSISLQFNGTAIYVFFVLANNARSGTTTLTDCNFTLNGQPPQNFKHSPDLTTTAMQYNALVYSQTNLPSRLHKLDIVTAGLDHDVYVNFDYAIYTHDDDPPVSSPNSISRLPSIRPVNTSRPVSRSKTRSVATSHSPSASVAASPGSSTTPVAAIAGGVVGGIILFSALIFLLFCLRRRKRGIPLVDHTEHWKAGPPPFMSEFDEPMNQPPAPYPHNAQPSFLSSASGGANYSSQVSLSTYSPYPNASPANLDNAATYNGIYGNVIVGYDDVRRGTSQNVSYVNSNSGISSTASQSGGQAGVPSSSATALGPNSDPQRRIRLARQREIDERLRTVQQEMRDLSQDLKGGRTTIRENQTVNQRQGEGEQEMSISEMKEQMRLMQQQISLLRKNQRSAWAQGLTDDPPLGYMHTNSTNRRVSNGDGPVS